MHAVVETVNVLPFDENTYIVGDTDTGQAAVIDPGGQAEEVVRVAASRGLSVSVIVSTHGHIDHVAGVQDLRALTGAPFLVHAACEPLLDALGRQAAMFGLAPVSRPHVDGHLDPTTGLAVGGMRLVVCPAPGHAPGHVVLVGPVASWRGEDVPVAFVGDVIFRDSIGRTDLWGGDYDTLLSSIQAEVLSLPDETVLLPGHGPATTVGYERGHNPFVLDWLRSHAPR
jgi:hydroxyacylglutathione hydrolase